MIKPDKSNNKPEAEELPLHEDGDRVEIPIRDDADEMEQGAEVDQAAGSDFTESSAPGASHDESGEPDASLEHEHIRLLEEQNLRLRAEFANYKRRVEREQAEYSEYIKAEILKELLPVWDDFRLMLERASDAEEEQTLLEGARMIYEKFESILSREGLVRIEALGAEFDPQIHEALMMRPTGDQSEDHKVLEVFQEGFKINERLIRPSKVIVGTFQESKE